MFATFLIATFALASVSEEVAALSPEDIYLSIQSTRSLMNRKSLCLARYSV